MKRQGRTTFIAFFMNPKRGTTFNRTLLKRFPRDADEKSGAGWWLSRANEVCGLSKQDMNMRGKRNWILWLNALIEFQGKKKRREPRAPECWFHHEHPGGTWKGILDFVNLIYVPYCVCVCVCLLCLLMGAREMFPTQFFRSGNQQEHRTSHAPAAVNLVLF